MQDDAFVRLCSPEMIKLALIYSMKHKKSKNTSSVKNTAEFINSTIYEKKKFILKEYGLNISKCLFIPYNIMPHGFVLDIDGILEKHKDYFFFVDSGDNNNIVVPNDQSADNMLGICNIVYGFFFAIKELKTSEKELYLMALRDSVVSNVVFEQRVEFPKIISKAIEYGYLETSQSNRTCCQSKLKVSDFVK